MALSPALNESLAPLPFHRRARLWKQTPDKGRKGVFYFYQFSNIDTANP
jgi:hypothetical protein